MYFGIPGRAEAAGLAFFILEIMLNEILVSDDTKIQYNNSSSLYYCLIPGGDRQQLVDDPQSERIGRSGD